MLTFEQFLFGFGRALGMWESDGYYVVEDLWLVIYSDHVEITDTPFGSFLPLPKYVDGDLSDDTMIAFAKVAYAEFVTMYG